jgi:sucrose-6-phosphate hydrolase SacC (GH32 family)
MDRKYETKKQQIELLLELQKWKSKYDKLNDELTKRTTEFEDYRKNSVPLSIHKPVVDKYLLGQQKIKSLQNEVTEMRIHQNMSSYYKKVIEKVSEEQPEIIIEKANKIGSNAEKKTLVTNPNIYGSIMKEDMASSSSGVLSRSQKRREQRKRKAQMFQQAKNELQAVFKSSRIEVDVQDGKTVIRNDTSQRESLDIDTSHQISLLFPTNNFQETIEQQEWMDFKSKLEIQKEIRDRLQFRSITTGQGEEFVNLSDSDD